jgi:hypothetical protein
MKVQQWNKKQAAANFVKQYKIPFEMKDDAIDLREMAKNYPNEIIPLDDIHQAITTMLGPKYATNMPAPYDPSAGCTITYPDHSLSPRFGYIEWNEMYLWTIFQRDVASNHVEKIFKGFNPTCIIVPCAIKITLKDGKPIYCIWDGHHTVQVCKLKNYTKFPVWFIDIDHVPLSEIEARGFGDTDDERIKYGVWLAGTNMRNINGKMKRPLHPYDDFLVGYETRDQQYVSMMNILRKNNCVPKRHATCKGAFTQIKSGIECYELADVYGNKGQFWDRALKVHRETWKEAPLTLEIFRPLSMLYHRANLEGITLTADFDKELMDMLVAKWGDPDNIQESIKDSYWVAYHKQGALTGNIPEHDKERVLAGIINFYKQNGGNAILPAPTCQWRV